MAEGYMIVLVLIALAQDVDQAVVTLSNGERLEGLFSLAEGRRLELFDVRTSKRFQIDPAEIARVSVAVEEAKLEQGWMFRAESNHEKIKLPYTYPLRTLLTDVTLVSGETLRGHATCVFYLEKDDDRRRLFLLTHQKGEKDQTLEDLTYVKEIVLPNRKAGDRKLGTITVKGTAAVVGLEREMSFQPPLTGLPAGRYDVFVFGEKKIRYGLTGGPISDEERKLLEDKISKIEEFFTKKRMVAAAKDGTVIRALIELTRTEESHDPGWKYARWEVWIFEPTKQSWNIRKRLHLHRRRYPENQGMPNFEYGAEDRLKAVPENEVID